MQWVTVPTVALNCVSGVFMVLHPRMQELNGLRKVESRRTELYAILSIFKIIKPLPIACSTGSAPVIKPLCCILRINPKNGHDFKITSISGIVIVCRI